MIRKNTYIMLKLNKRSDGFTLAELLIVVVIIAVLAAISIVAYSNISGRARDSKRISELRHVAKLVELYKADNGGYPTCSGTGTYQANTTANSGLIEACLKPELVPKYADSLPLDPINADEKRYFYAVGYQKNDGVNSYVNNESSNYILGATMDYAGGTNYGGWGFTLNYLIGSAN
jgi:prepilin-type N-terminal cleavage/methylation domain-containing protein